MAADPEELRRRLEGCGGLLVVWRMNDLQVHAERATEVFGRAMGQNSRPRPSGAWCGLILMVATDILLVWLLA